MPDIMTDAEIAELRALDAAATPGPWSAMRAIDERFYRDWSRSAPPNGRGYIHQTTPTLSDEDQFARYEDAAFIAAARNALPRLLAMLDAERAEVARLREAARGLCDRRRHDPPWREIVSARRL